MKSFKQYLNENKLDIPKHHNFDQARSALEKHIASQPDYQKHHWTRSPKKSGHQVLVHTVSGKTVNRYYFDKDGRRVEKPEGMY